MPVYDYVLNMLARACVITEAKQHPKKKFLFVIGVWSEKHITQK